MGPMGAMAGGYGPWAGGWWFLWPLGWIVMLVGLFALWRWLGPRHWYGHGAAGPWGPTDPLTILQARLARGEIDSAEFERLRDQLKR